MLDLSLLLLTLDEGETIGELVREARAELDRMGISYEVLVVDGGSRDRTREAAAASGARVLVQQRAGYGGALVEGLTAAAGRYVLTLDADGSHPPSLIRTLWQSRGRAAVVVASRFVTGGTSRAPLYRRLLSRLLSSLVARVLSLPVRDPSSGFRLYERRVLRPAAYRSQTFSVLLEVLVHAYVDGYRLAEVPLAYAPRRSGRSHARIVRFGIDYLRALLAMWTLRNSVDAADYDHRAFDSLIPLQRYWQRRRYRLVKGLLGSPDGAILDVACGSSRIIQSLPEAVGLDLSLPKLRFLAATNPRRVRATLFALPFADGAFGGVIHSQVLEHVPFRPEIFGEVHRVLAAGGTLVVGTPDYGRPWWPLIERAYRLLLPNAYADEHITHYTRGRLLRHVEEAGFRPLEHRYILGGELIVKAVKRHPEAAGRAAAPPPPASREAATAAVPRPRA